MVRCECLSLARSHKQTKKVNKLTNVVELGPWEANSPFGPYHYDTLVTQNKILYPRVLNKAFAVVEQRRDQ
jgi:hypothetical protein